MEQVADAGSSTKTVPVDLIVEILSLLPAKSIIRFQSVSKLWFSIIRSKDLVNTFLTRSKTRPRLLLVLELFELRKRLSFSVPEHKINDKISTALDRQDIAHSIGLYHHVYRLPLPVNGFVCFNGTFSSTSVYNLVTRQTVKLPDVGNNGRVMYTRLGYDPVEDQYKVLCSIYKSDQDNQLEHYVCAVSSSQKQEWRKIGTTVDNYYHVYLGICIDGAIYYGAGESNIYRFDVRSEKMDLIKGPEESNIFMACYFTLVNYNGRLGGVEFDYNKEEIRLWILEDIEKQEWSSMKFRYPCEWKGFGYHLESNGLVHTGELMVFKRSLKKAKTFRVYYYDFNKESSRMVEIQGVETDEQHERMVCYPGYVENIRFL